MEATAAWKRLPPGEDPDAVFGEGAIGYAARAGTREALALLRALAVLGVTPAQRNAASRAAAACGAMPLCDILADPDHPDHAERADWLGHPYDPAAFDKDAVNASLARIRLG